MAGTRQAAPSENPLVPNAVLQRMYEGMRELRALGSRAGARSLRGEEACRVSSMLLLAAGDLVSDVPGSRVAVQAKGSSRTAMQTMAPGALLLPQVDGAGGADGALERLMLAVGAAGALRAQGAGRLVLVYADAAEMPAARWRQVLGVAGRGELPIVFVLLPSAEGQSQGMLSDRAQGWGVPGMPVDAADGVALYRVMQESVLRARGGDGPALIECVRWQPKGVAMTEADGLAAMRRLLALRGLLPAGRRKSVT